MPDNGRSFFDSNVIIYSLSRTGDKSIRAKDLVQTGGIISVQVLNEVANISARKLSKTWPEINTALELIRSFCQVVPLTVKTHDTGRYIAERYKLSVYDAMIVAAAFLADCDILYSEDMQNGMLINNKLTIVNPFQTAAIS
jgi:predicted nucleic acid-binding protein